MAFSAPGRILADLSLFGRIALTPRDEAGEPVEAAPLSSRRARAILAFTALQRDATATRARLSGLLWSDRAEAQARASLRQALTDLKLSAGAQVLEAGRDAVRLRVERLCVDVLELEAALDEGDAPAVTALLTRIGAEVLCDEPAVSDLHQEWLDQARAGVERRLAAGVHAILGAAAGSESASAAGSDPGAARALADAFLSRQPLDEVATASAMRAEVALGAAAAAVIRFVGFKAALARELHVAPGATVQAALTAALGASVAPRPSPSDAPGGAPAARAGEDLAVPTVVVAAFADGASGEGASAGWAAALRDEVVAGLSRFRELAVVSDARPAEGVAREPWAGRQDVYLLSGAAHERGGAGRFVAQLARMADGGVVWSEGGVLAADAPEPLIDRVVARVVGSALPAIQADLAPRVRPAPQGAYSRFLLARDAAARPTTWEAARAAADDLERLVADAPEFSLAYLPLARLYNTDFGFTRAGSSGPAERRRAFDLCKTALALDRSHVHAYTVMGWCYLWRRGWDVARRHFDQAVAQNPFNAERLMEVGFGSLFLGEVDRARALLERCLLLNPAPKDGFFMDLGLLELIEGRHDLAQAHFDMVALPTIFDDIYSAANAVLAGAEDAERTARARARVAAIWDPAVPASAEAMTAWFADSHPFRAREVADRLTGAVRRVLRD